MSQLANPSSSIVSQIPFGRPAIVGRELDYIRQALANGSIAGGGIFSCRCEAWLEAHLPARRVLLTHSCTAALEMAAILSGISAGDEVVMPSFTFSSTAAAFVLRGAIPIFVDIRPDTLALDETLIESALTDRTRAIVPVHYAGVAAEMNSICRLARARKLMVIEDAAQAHLSTYEDRSLGTIGDLGCLSFHETKNVISGEGGALLINDENLIERAEIVREKGTDRSRFFRGEVDRYTWHDIGSSYAPSEIVAAFLYAQLEHSEAICQRRRTLYDLYRDRLSGLARNGDITTPSAPGRRANGHIFWILTADAITRAALIEHLARRGIGAVFHYVPLHSSPAGMRFGRSSGGLSVTNAVSQRLLRLPLYLELTDSDVLRVCEVVESFFGYAS